VSVPHPNAGNFKYVYGPLVLIGQRSFCRRRHRRPSYLTLLPLVVFIIIVVQRYYNTSAVRIRTYLLFKKLFCYSQPPAVVSSGDLDSPNKYTRFYSVIIVVGLTITEIYYSVGHAKQALER